MKDQDQINKDVNDAIEKMREARSNVQRGLRLLVFAVIRFFLEIWIVQSIWNELVAAKFDVPMFTYWESLGVMFMIRIITGQFKINFSAGKNG